MRKKSATVILLVIFVIGLSLLLYPAFSDWWNSFHQSRAIASYSELLENLDEEQYMEIWNNASSYNRSLAERTNGYLLSDEQKEAYDQLLNVGGNGIMGYIEIPIIDQRLPIYHGTSEGVLQIAIGHLEWSSLPVGGESSHTVLSGHRGLPSARLFTDLDKVVIGDVFMLRILDEVLTYQVDQILIVDPDDTESLMIEEGQDLCTLVTCTPYGINTHRLLVRGHRIETVDDAPVRITSDALQIEPIAVAPVVASPMILVLLIILMFPRKKKKKITVESLHNLQIGGK